MTDINKLVVEEIEQLKILKGGGGTINDPFVPPKENSKDKTPLPKEEKIKNIKPEGHSKDVNPKSGEKASNLLQKKLQRTLTKM